MADLNRIGGQHYEIMRRCYNENYVSYKDYGAKGIKVCPEWHDREVFKAWALDHGYVKGKRVLRYDTKGNYTPENCYIGDSSYKTIIKGRNKGCKEHAQMIKAKKAEIGVNRLKDHPLSETYHGMKTRCYNPNARQYKYYGARGIKICDEWLGEDGFYNFAKWAQECGEWEEGLTIDRIDVNGDYCPENCRWATLYEQAQNKRRNHIFFVNGEMLSAMSFCALRGIDYNKFLDRYKKGINISEILDELEK